MVWSSAVRALLRKIVVSLSAKLAPLFIKPNFSGINFKQWSKCYKMRFFYLFPIGLFNISGFSCFFYVFSFVGAKTRKTTVKSEVLI